MKSIIEKSYRHYLSDKIYCDISVYQSKWITKIDMTLWKKGNGVAINFEERSYINFDRFLPIKISEKIGRYLLNSQLERVCGCKIF